MAQAPRTSPHRVSRSADSWRAGDAAGRRESAFQRPPPLRTKQETWLRRPMSLALIRSSPAVELNPEQQLAVEYGIGEPKGSGPLLVIAGAGSGKTAMLPHRVGGLLLS